jgi:arginine utilization regulatory protein
MIMAEGHTLTVKHLPIQLQQIKKSTETKGVQPLRSAMQEMEISLIKQALLQTNSNIQQAAALLEIPRQTLQYKIQKLNIVV